MSKSKNESINGSNQRWKDVVGYEGNYKVSDCGEILNAKTGKFLKGSLQDGYRRFSLSKDKSKKNLLGHRLVAQAFLKNEENLPQVNHKDGVKFNNYHSNLEWNTPKQNVRHAAFLGLRAIGERNGSAKLNADKVIAIRKMSKKGMTHKDLASLCGVNTFVIYKVIHRINWSHV